jgi:bifunctional DNA-binding transcriptional regulator/antitoxin component of YhaV-PrlF toxin-antitoxin module
MTDNKTVKKSSIEDEELPVVEITSGGQITVPKALRGNEDGYTIEKRDDGRYILTPLKIGYEPVEQSAD